MFLIATCINEGKRKCSRLVEKLKKFVTDEKPKKKETKFVAKRNGTR